MKSIMRSAVLVALIFFCVNADAQRRGNPGKVGFKGGLNLNDQFYNYAESNDEPFSKFKLGYHLGLTSEIRITRKVALQLGLQFIKKGSSVDLEAGLQEGQTVEGKAWSTYSYLELPVHFAVKFDDFQVYGGPFIAVGLSGKTKADYAIKSSSGTTDIQFEGDIKPLFGERKITDVTFGGGTFNALDYGANLGVGYELSDALLLNAGFSLGLGNTVNGVAGLDFNPADQKTTNYVISVSTSYFFGQ